MQAGEALSEEKLKALSLIWNEDLDEIPAEKIYKSFQSARKGNKTRKIPSPAMVLDAYRQLGDFTTDGTRGLESHYYGPFGEGVLNGTWLPIYRALACQMTEREAYLLESWKDGSMRDEDQPEWEVLKKKKFWYPKGVIQKPIDKWDNSDFINYGKVSKSWKS